MCERHWTIELMKQVLPRFARPVAARAWPFFSTTKGAAGMRAPAGIFTGGPKVLLGLRTGVWAAKEKDARSCELRAARATGVCEDSRADGKRGELSDCIGDTDTDGDDGRAAVWARDDRVDPGCVPDEAAEPGRERGDADGSARLPLAGRGALLPLTFRGPEVEAASDGEAPPSPAPRPACLAPDGLLEPNGDAAPSDAAARTPEARRACGAAAAATAAATAAAAAVFAAVAVVAAVAAAEAAAAAAAGEVLESRGAAADAEGADEAADAEALRVPAADSAGGASTTLSPAASPGPLPLPNPFALPPTPPGPRASERPATPLPGAAAPALFTPAADVATLRAVLGSPSVRSRAAPDTGGPASLGAAPDMRARPPGWNLRLARVAE